jgi:hypothetical protein
MALPEDDALLGRREAAAALTSAGFRTAPATLATRAVRGGGPPFMHYGPRVLYRWADLIAWARSRLGPAIRSTSELDAR